MKQFLLYLHCIYERIYVMYVRKHFIVQHKLEILRNN